MENKRNMKQIDKKNNTLKYYNTIAPSYNQLYFAEQIKKLEILNEAINQFLLNANDSMKPFILDVGAGTGISTHFFLKRKHTIIGIEPSKELLQNAIDTEVNPYLKEGFAEKIPFKKDTFDITISVSALQNFFDTKKALLEIKRVTKKKNSLIILTFVAEEERTKELLAEIKQVFPNIKKTFKMKDTFCIISDRKL